ncbi:MAG: hypothetical protein EA382_14200 [Spirochaetaceae bacterium]|nr:MAG: hypothetical protein EA382_14200 [Spirochaetaceae bacterium]
MNDASAKRGEDLRLVVHVGLVAKRTCEKGADPFEADHTRSDHANWERDAVEVIGPSREVLRSLRVVPPVSLRRAEPRLTG